MRREISSDPGDAGAESVAKGVGRRLVGRRSLSVLAATIGQGLVLLVVLAMTLSPVAGVTGVGAVLSPSDRPHGVLDDTGPPGAGPGASPGAVHPAVATTDPVDRAESRTVTGTEPVDRSGAAAAVASRAARSEAQNAATAGAETPEFEYSPDVPTVGEAVQFDGTPVTSEINGTIANATYEWTFGDGSNATGATPAHTYDSSGFATVTLFADVVTESGTSYSVVTRQTVMVATSDPPKGEFSYAPERPTLGDTVQFDASDTPVPENATDVSYTWNVGLQRFEGPTPTYNISDSASSTVEFPVSIPVRLRVNVTTDSGSTTYVAEKPLTIYEGSGGGPGWITDERDPANVTTTGSAANLTAGQCGEAAASKSYGRHDGSMTVAFDYEYSIETTEQRPTVTAFTGIDSPTFRVGSPGSGTGHFEQTVDVDGTPTVTLSLDEKCVGDGEIHFDVRNFEITLTNETDAPPTAAFSYEPDDPSADVPVEFEADASDDGSVASREWDFDGDGTTDATGDDVSHTYGSEGIYTVTLTVTDDEGQTDTAQKAVSVGPPPSEQFDDDGDGLEGDELRDALDNVTGTTDPSPGTNGTTTNGTDGNETGGVNVGEARSAIDDYISGPTGDPLANASENTSDIDGDGLSDALEKNGIPVKRAYNLTDYQSEAFDNADVVGTTEEGYPLLDTSYVDADTDGDGISDRGELRRAVFESNPDPRESGDLNYYRLKSDPTDANTDDTGADDEEELKKGSDSTTPEWFSVNAVVPVIGEEGCETGSGVETNNCAKNLQGYEQGYGIKPVAEFNHDSKFDDIPGWLERIDDSKIKQDRTYYLVRVRIRGEAVVPETRSLPNMAKISGFTHHSATIVGQGTSRDAVYDSDVVDPFVEGTESGSTMYLAVRSSQDESPNNGKFRDLGKLEMKVWVPADRIFARQHDPYAGSGRRIVTVTSESTFAVRDVVRGTSPGEARDMVREAAQKFGQNAVSAAVPVNAGAGLAAASFSTLSKPAFTAGTLLVNEGVALFTGIGDAPAGGVDDMVGKAVAGEGAVPAYLDREDAKPTANVIVTVYRSN